MPIRAADLIRAREEAETISAAAAEWTKVSEQLLSSLFSPSLAHLHEFVADIPRQAVLAAQPFDATDIVAETVNGLWDEVGAKSVVRDLIDQWSIDHFTGIAAVAEAVRSHHFNLPVNDIAEVAAGLWRQEAISSIANLMQASAVDAFSDVITHRYAQDVSTLGITESAVVVEIPETATARWSITSSLTAEQFSELVTGILAKSPLVLTRDDAHWLAALFVYWLVTGDARGIFFAIFTLAWQERRRRLLDDE